MGFLKITHSLNNLSYSTQYQSLLEAIRNETLCYWCWDRWITDRNINRATRTWCMMKSLLQHSGEIYEVGPPKQNLFIKNCVFILACLNFSHLQSTLHFMHCTYRDILSTDQNSFWTHQFWRLLVGSGISCFTALKLAKCFPLRVFFIWRNKKNSPEARPDK